MEGRSNVVLNMHAQLQISHPKRFLSFLQYASQCAFGNGVCWLLVLQFFSLFASLKQQQSLMKIMFSCIHLPVWPYPSKIMIFKICIPVNCMGWQVWLLYYYCYNLLYISTTKQSLFLPLVPVVLCTVTRLGGGGGGGHNPAARAFRRPGPLLRPHNQTENNYNTHTHTHVHKTTTMTTDLNAGKFRFSVWFSVGE